MSELIILLHANTAPGDLQISHPFSIDIMGNVCHLHGFWNNGNQLEEDLCVPICPAVCMIPLVVSQLFPLIKENGGTLLVVLSAQQSPAFFLWARSVLECTVYIFFLLCKCTVCVKVNRAEQYWQFIGVEEKGLLESSFFN